VISLVWLNVPLAILVFVAIVAIPMWMTFRRPEGHPDYSEARAHFRTKAAGATLRPTVPGRRHSGAPAAVRSHAEGADRRTRV
jgi:hypothetical protein